MSYILIIDDDEMVRASLDMILRASGWQTEQAESGVDGLAKARRSPPGLIICDLTMRGMGGLEFLAAVRGDAVLKSVPVFIMTGSEAEHVEQEVLRQGAQAVLLKPFESDQLGRLVGAHLGTPPKPSDLGSASTAEPGG